MAFNLVKFLKENYKNVPNYRLRNRRGFYASSALKCRRDEFWSWTGEEETNPPDFFSSFKMMLGSAVEDAIRVNWLQKLSQQGLHFLGTQIPVGGSNPPWDGYVDFFIKHDSEELPTVVEFKTSWGEGANFLFANPRGITKEEYFIQLGLYLKDFHDKGHDVNGALWFAGISDKHFGRMLQYNCTYNADKNMLFCNSYNVDGGEEEFINLKFDLNAIEKRWNGLIENIKAKKCPPPDYNYKHPLTEDFLANVSDYQLKRAIDGVAVLGDWQPKYSSYKNKALQLDGTTIEYTDNERQLMLAEYLRRHPRSKVV